MAARLPHLSEPGLDAERTPCGSDVLNHNSVEGSGSGCNLRGQPSAVRSLTSPVLPCHPGLGLVSGGSLGANGIGGEVPRVNVASEAVASEVDAVAPAGLEKARWKHLWSYAFPYATPAVAEEQELGLPVWWLQALEPATPLAPARTGEAGKGVADKEAPLPPFPPCYAAGSSFFSELPDSAGLPAAWLQNLELEAGKGSADKDGTGKDASDMSGKEARNPAAVGTKRREKVTRKRASVVGPQPRLHGCSGIPGAPSTPLLQQATSPPMRAGMSGWSSPKDASLAPAKDTRSIFFGLGVRQMLDEIAGTEGVISPSHGVGRSSGHYRARSLV